MMNQVVIAVIVATVVIIHSVVFRKRRVAFERLRSDIVSSPHLSFRFVFYFFLEKNDSFID